MRLVSTDNQSELTITVVEDEHGYKASSLTAQISLGHSEFKGSNSDINFLNLPDFIRDLDAFILNRKIEPKLNGTYGSYILFRGTNTSVAIIFKIGGAFCGTDTYNYSVTGTFEIDQGQLGEIVNELRKNA